MDIYRLIESDKNIKLVAEREAIPKKRIPKNKNNPTRVANTFLKNFISSCIFQLVAKCYPTLQLFVKVF